MLRFLLKYSLFILRLLIVITINFILFLMIPLTHSLSGKIKNKDNISLREPVVITEYIKPAEKKEKREYKPRIRQLESSVSGQSSQTTSINLKFVPDLAVQGSEDGVAMSSAELDVIVFEEGEVDQDAQPINRTPIPYPQRTRELGIEGDLVLILLIDTNGKVSSIDVVSSPDQLISRKATEIILSSWKFKPAHNQGIPVKQRVKQKITFRLNS